MNRRRYAWLLAACATAVLFGALALISLREGYYPYAGVAFIAAVVAVCWAGEVVAGIRRDRRGRRLWR